MSEQSIVLRRYFVSAGTALMQNSVAGKSARSCKGFTLFEVLVVMAFMALLTGLVTLNFDKLIPAVQEKPLDRAFIEAMQDARILAATSGNEVYFSFDAASEKFVLEERTRENPFEEEMEEELYDPSKPPPNSFGFQDSEETEVIFYKRLSQSDAFGASADEYSTEPTKFIVFHPSGASTPARVIIRRPDVEELVVDLDPFSSGPFQKEEGY